MSDKVQFVVIAEGALCYVAPEQPRSAHVLAISYQRNRSHVFHNGDSTYFPRDDSRPATRADFDTFRVSSKGYESDDRYDFPKE